MEPDVHVVLGFICILGLALMLGLLGWVTHNLSNRLHRLESKRDTDAPRRG